MPKRIVIGISGASGVIYGVRIVDLLKEMDLETHLIISESGKKILLSRPTIRWKKCKRWHPPFIRTLKWVQY